MVSNLFGKINNNNNNKNNNTVLVQVTLREDSNQQVRNLQNQLEEEQRQAQNRLDCGF